jgi:phytol kinase
MPMSPSVAVAVSVAYFIALTVAFECLRRRFRVAPDISRKCLHLALGLWSIPTVNIFADGRWAVVPYLLWAAFAYVSYRFEVLRALEDEGRSLGSIFFPLSTALLLWLFWGRLAYVALAGIMAMSLGDTLAAIVGRRLGTRKYRTLGHPRTMEGTLTLFLVASGSIASVLVFVAGLDLHQAVAFSLISGTVAASVETVSIYGSDNFTVPVATAATLFVLINTSALNQ